MVHLTNSTMDHVPNSPLNPPPPVPPRPIISFNDLLEINRQLSSLAQDQRRQTAQIDSIRETVFDLLQNMASSSNGYLTPPRYRSINRRRSPSVPYQNPSVNRQ